MTSLELLTLFFLYLGLRLMLPAMLLLLLGAWRERRAFISASDL
jgi:hypothetical protein